MLIHTPRQGTHAPTWYPCNVFCPMSQESMKRCNKVHKDTHALLQGTVHINTLLQGTHAHTLLQGSHTDIILLHGTHTNTHASTQTYSNVLTPFCMVYKHSCSFKVHTRGTYTLSYRV